MEKQTRDFRVRGNRCDIIKGDIKPEDGTEQIAYNKAYFEFSRLIYSFLFAFFQWDSNFHLNIKNQVKRQLENNWWQDHDATSKDRFEISDEDLLTDVGREIREVKKIKRELLQDVDQYAEMLFFIKDCKQGKQSGEKREYEDIK